MIKALFILVAGALLCGCTAVAPVASSMAGPLSQQPVQANTHTAVNLSEGNFVVVKTNVVGRSKGFSLLGLITIYPATTTKAMSRALSGCPVGRFPVTAKIVWSAGGPCIVPCRRPPATVT